MLRYVKYLVTCDDCGSDSYGAYKHKSDIKKNWVIYRYHKVNPMADELFAKELGYTPVKELHFCNPCCAERYFNYYPEQKSHYKLCK